MSEDVRVLSKISSDSTDVLILTFVFIFCISLMETIPFFKNS